MEDKVCDCSQINRETYGYRDVEGGRKCNYCSGKIAFSPTEELEKAPPAPERESFDPASLDLAAQEEVITRLIQSLAGSGKYRKALSNGDFAAFSLIGTNDWEDYASTVLRTVLLKETLRIDKNLEEIKELLIKIEKKL